MTRPSGPAAPEAPHHPQPLARRALLNGGLLVASLALASVAGEILVRAVAPEQLVLKRPDVWKAADTLGWVHHTNVHTTLNTGERTIRFVTDGDGFRIGQGARPHSHQRILLLGDSFMEALQVEYEHSLAGLLEARLPRSVGAPLAVANAAVGGWDPPQYLLQARALLPKHEFALILVALYVGNDAVPTFTDRIPPRVPNQVHALRFPRNLRWREQVDAVLYPVNDFLEVRSHAFVLLKTRFQTALMRLGLSAAYFPREFLRSEAAAPRWEVTAGICREIAALGERDGVPTLFVLVPTAFQVDPAVFARYLRGFRIDSTQVDLNQPTALLWAALRKHRLNVIDALPAFRRAHAAGLRLYGTVDSHLAPAGHDVLERHIEPAVAALLGTMPRHASVRPPPRDP